MTDYWGDTANTSGTVSTDKLQKIYLSQSQTVSQVYVKEGQNVKKGDKLLAYDTTLSQAEVEGAQIQLERMQLELETAKNNLSLYRKAENREELQKEYDRVAAILEKLLPAGPAGRTGLPREAGPSGRQPWPEQG